MILPFSSTIDCTGSSLIRLLNCWLLLFSHQTVTPLHIGHDATQPHRPIELLRKNVVFVPSVVGCFCLDVDIAR